jgi:hypothetical protein
MVLLMIVQTDILLSSLLGTDKVSGVVMVHGQYHTCCCCWTCSWLSLLFKLLLSFVFGLLTHFFKIGFCLSHALWLVAVWCQIWNIYNLITWSSLNAFQVEILRWRYYSYEDLWDWHCCSYCFQVFFFWFLGRLFSVFSFLLWNSLWLVEEMLTVLCLFLIIRMEICQFLWEIYLSF